MQPSRNAFNAAGTEYLAHVTKFKEFIDDLLKIQPHVASLTFGDRVPHLVDFVFMGQQQRLRFDFRNAAGKWVGTITRLFKGDPDDEDYTGSHAVFIDKHGNIGTPGGAFPWNVQNDSERAFYYLMLGQ